MAGKSVLRSIKNVTNGYSSSQILVRECTSNDQSSPTITIMSEIADLTYKNGSFQDVMDILDKRLNDKGKNWRHVAKALTLLDYLVRYGSDDVIIWGKNNLYIIKTLREFSAKDSQGNDQGSIIRVKAKELTSLLQDDERLAQEREAAQKSGSRGRRRHGNRRNRSRNNFNYDDDDDVYDEALQVALEKSKETAEEEERRRREQSDHSLERAIQLSLEEEEMRKKNQNLLDLNDDTAPDVYGFYQQQQQQPQGQIIGYDMFGNPVYGNQPMATGYLENAYQDLAAQQLALQQAQAEVQAQAEAQAQAQAQAQALYLQQQQQQQQMYQQQLTAAANSQVPLQTGSNNPFGQQQQQQQQLLLQQQQEQQQQQQQQQLLLLQKQKEAEEEAKRREEELNKQQQLLEQQQQQLLQQQQRVQQLQQASQSPIKPTLTGSQKMTQQYSELNQLLSQGTGIDTFGNEGEARIPAQFTKTGTFINSQGTGYRQVTSQGNPFLDTQFTGVGVTTTATSIVPSETGYGFGNQQPQRSNAANYNSLIDL